MADEPKPKISWDDSKMQLNYANVCNVSSTREEFNLLFGTNKSWNTAKKDINIELTNRIVMNPPSAKRLAILLANAVQKYEAEVGPLDLGVTSDNPIQ